MVVKMIEDKKFTFLISAGRTGSTLLLGVLNSIDGYTIVGENHNAYVDLRSFYEKMLSATQAYESNDMGYESVNSWYARYDKEDLKQYVRELCASLIDNKAHTVGFKEIRYPNLGFKLTGHLNWMHSVFKPRFIYLTRNIEDVCKSEWWAKNPAKSKATLTQFNNDMIKHIANHPAQEWFHLTYEDMVDNRLEKLFEFLDEPYDAKKLQEEVLNVRHGYKTKGKWPL